MSDRNAPTRIAGMAPGYLLCELDRLVNDLRKSGRLPAACRSTVLGPSLVEIAVRFGVLDSGTIPVNDLAARFSFAPLLPDAPENVCAFLGDFVWMVREAASEERTPSAVIEIDLPERLRSVSLASQIWETLWIPSIRRAVDRYELPYPTADLLDEYLQNIDCRLNQLDGLLPRLKTVESKLAETLQRFLEMFGTETAHLIRNENTRETLERVTSHVAALLK